MHNTGFHQFRPHIKRRQQYCHCSILQLNTGASNSFLHPVWTLEGNHTSTGPFRRVRRLRMWPFYYYPTTWAAMCHLPRIYLPFRRVDATMQGLKELIVAEDSLHVTMWDSSVARAPDLWLKGHGFKSLQERRENFPLQGQLSVLTLISVSVPPHVTAVSRKRSSSFCQKCRWQVTAKTCIHVTYVALHEVTWCMVVWCPQNLCWDSSSFTWHQPYQRLSTPLGWIFKNAL